MILRFTDDTEEKHELQAPDIDNKQNYDQVSSSSAQETKVQGPEGMEKEISSQDVTSEDVPVVALKLTKIDRNSFNARRLNHNVELKEFTKATTFETDQAFYEFQHQFENVFHRNNLIFMKKVKLNSVQKH